MSCYSRDCGVVFAKRSDRIGGLIAALPLITVLSLIWLHIEQQPITELSIHAYYTFWYVIPTLPMFLLFPYLIHKMNFWLCLSMCLIFTLFFFGLYALLLSRFGIDLL